MVVGLRSTCRVASVHRTPHSLHRNGNSILYLLPLFSPRNIPTVLVPTIISGKEIVWCAVRLPLQCAHRSSLTVKPVLEKQAMVQIVSVHSMYRHSGGIPTQGPNSVGTFYVPTLGRYSDPRSE